MLDSILHKKVIDHVLGQLNEAKDNPFILKGGTALMECYSLDRFSEDIDLDAAGETTPREQIFEKLGKLCETQGYEMRIAKNTETVGRAMIHYSRDRNPLKVEVSYRRREISDEITQVINNIKVYTIDELCQMKSSTYLSRDKVRDLYDLTFICVSYYDRLSESAKDALFHAFELKGLEQFDYLIRNSEDELIDKEHLMDMLLRSHDIVGLLASPKQAPPRVIDNPFAKTANAPGAAATPAEQERAKAAAKAQARVGSLKTHNRKK